MNKLLYKMKNNKLLTGVVIGILLVILFDLFVIIFDIVQFVKLQENSINRFAGFAEINITAGVLNILAIAVILVYLILRKRKLKVQISDKTKSR